VTAYLPAIGKSVDQQVTIEAGKVQELTLTLPFSLADYEASLAKPADIKPVDIEPAH
jgi:hypothetical protein